MTDFKPMLCITAKKLNPEKLYRVERKMDGIRGYILDGSVYSRSQKLIPNQRIQEAFNNPELNGADGEFIHPDGFRATQSIVMSDDKDITGIEFVIFDNFLRSGPIKDRMKGCESKCFIGEFLGKEIPALLENVLRLGEEGLVIKELDQIYTFGKNKNSPVKLKGSMDSEFTITGLTPGKGKYLGKLGALICTVNGRRFEVGSGLTDEERTTLNTPETIGKLAKVKYMSVGMKDVPRQPVFLGLRSAIDLGE